MKSNFEKYLERLFDLSPESISLCEGLTRFKDVEKGEVLVRTGEVYKNLFFVERGLLKQYFIDRNGKEHILYFAPENWLVGDRNSAYFREATDFTVEAVEDSHIIVLDTNFIVDLSQRFPDKIIDADLLIHRHVRQLQKRICLLLGASAEERYLDFVSTYPNLMQRVPQWMIASYLGITPESLSRVRRDLAKKNFLLDGI